MLTYRSDIGIPGYTGYTPGWATVPIPINGSNTHTGEQQPAQQQCQQPLLIINFGPPGQAAEVRTCHGCSGSASCHHCSGETKDTRKAAAPLPT